MAAARDVALSESTMNSMFARTDPTLKVGPVPATGKTVSCGVGLKESEVAEVDELASSNGVARNMILRYAVRSFLGLVRSGEIQLNASREVVEKITLKMP